MLSNGDSAMMKHTFSTFTPSAVLRGLWEELGTELLLAGLFCMGFVLFRFTVVRRLILGEHSVLLNKKAKAASAGEARVDSAASHRPSSQAAAIAAKELEANWAAGRGDLVLEAWPSLSCFTLGALRAVLEALVAKGGAADAPTILRRLLSRHHNLRNAEALDVALDALPGSLAAEVRQMFAKAQSLSSAAGSPTHSGGGAGHTHHLRIRAAVDNRNVEEAIAGLVAVREANIVPVPACIVSVVRMGFELGDSAVIKKLPSGALTAEAVTALMEHAAKAGDVSLLREVHECANDRMLPLSNQACEAFLRGCAASGDGSAIEVFDDLVQGGFSPSEGALTAAVSLCAESRHVQMAEHCVNYARRVHGRVALALYSALMKVYSHAKLWHKTCELYEIMSQEGVTPDTVVYGSMIKAAVESGRPEFARRLFKESGNPDLLNYMSLIRAAGRERDVPKALRLLDELEKSPLSADSTAYNCTLEACAACGDHVSAKSLLKRMESSGHVDVVSYNTYLKVLLSQGAHSEVAEVLREMQAKGLKPNAVTYNSMIKDAVAKQDLNRAWLLVHQMEQATVKPDAFTCSILMKGVKHGPSVEDVDKIIMLVQRNSVTPDEVLINCLLDACVRLRDVQRLTQVLDQFKATGVVPSPHAYAMLIRAYGHVRRLDKAWSLWKDLTGGHTAAPGEEAFASMVDACLANGDLAGATAVFREVREQLCDYARGPAVFAAFVKACMQCKQSKLAMDLYDETKDNISCSKVTYNTLIDALVRQGDVGRATDLFRDMALKNVSPDLITYSTLIKGHCTRGDLEQGLQLLGLMQRRGIAPDAILFNSILDGCAHKQMRALTEQVLRDMEAAGIAPSNFTLSILVKLYGRCNDLEAAFAVVDTYPEKYSFKLNAQVYTCLMSACIANGELARALEVYDRMNSAGCPSDSKTYQTLISGCLRHGDLDGAFRLVEDALRGPSARLDCDAAEGVLLMAARRGRAADLALPLLDRLQEAGITVSSRVVSAVRRHEDESPNAQQQQPMLRARSSGVGRSTGS